MTDKTISTRNHKADKSAGFQFDSPEAKPSYLDIKTQGVEL
jgi:hypothetical protein